MCRFNRALCGLALGAMLGVAMLRAGFAHSEELDAAIGQDDSRFTIETDSIRVHENKYAAAAGYHYSAEARTKYGVVVKGCDKGYGAVTLLLDASGKNDHTFPWRASGPKVYDLISKLVCDRALGP